MAGDLEYFGVPPTGQRDVENRNEFVAAAGQTLFNFIYTVGYLDVYHNGVKLASDEFTAANGTTVTLAQPAVEGARVQLIARRQVPVSDVYTRIETARLANEFYLIATGTANAVSGQTEPLMGFDLSNGREIKVRWPLTNTVTNPNINVNGLGAIPITCPQGQPVPIGALETEGEYTFRYNSTTNRFIIVNPGEAVSLPPTRWDYSSRIANTEFVKNLGETYSGSRNITGTVTLDASYIGSFIWANGTGSYFVTLPTPTTVMAGASMRIQNLCLNAIIINRPNTTQSIFVNTNAQGSLTLQPGYAVDLTTDGTSWFASNNGAFPHVSAINNTDRTGWVKLPNGFIMQWGSELALSNQSSGTRIQFPTAFPTKCVAMSGADVAGSSFFPTFTINAAGQSPSPAFHVWGFAAGTGSSTSITINWMAIGY